MRNEKFEQGASDHEVTYNKCDYCEEEGPDVSEQDVYSRHYTDDQGYYTKHRGSAMLHPDCVESWEDDHYNN